MTMQPLQAHVKNGRLVLDEPTELPEGTSVWLMAVDDDIETKQRARMLAAMSDGMEAPSKMTDMSESDYEVWADETQAPPYILLLRFRGGVFEILDPQEKDRIRRVATYDDAANQLWEDEYTRVARWELLEPD